MDNDKFESELFSGLIKDCFVFQTHNEDYLRFPKSFFRRCMQRAKESLSFCLGKALLRLKGRSLDGVMQELDFILKNNEGFKQFYFLLRDDFSRRQLVELLKFKILGACHVKVRLNNAEYWRAVKLAKQEFLVDQNVSRVGTFSLNRYEVKFVNKIIDIICHPLNILNTFLLKEYEYKHGHRSIMARAGDVVIDGGGCWGDTALYFSSLVGGEGHVYCFEFENGNLKIFNRNMVQNFGLSKQITLIPQALWNIPEQLLNFDSSGPGTAVTAAEGYFQVKTETLDNLLDKNLFTRVNFIKLDIEGSELNALRGSEKVLRKFKPRLAISLYHKKDDFLTIPTYLNSLGLGYEFYLDHFTIHAEETVLFCCVDREGE